LILLRVKVHPAKDLAYLDLAPILKLLSQLVEKGDVPSQRFRFGAVAPDCIADSVRRSKILNPEPIAAAAAFLHMIDGKACVTVFRSVHRDEKVTYPTTWDAVRLGQESLPRCQESSLFAGD
jgi:hypothetical protein